MPKPRRITLVRLKEVLNYNPDTGAFIWIKPSGRRVKAGQKAGVYNSWGYRYICIDNEKLAASRLAWFYMTGAWPIEQIDHIDCNRANNIFTNLREATLTENNRNRPIRTTNTSGVKGVYWHAGGRKWAAGITVNRQSIHLGLFTDIEMAREARKKAELEHFGEFAHWG